MLLNLCLAQIHTSSAAAPDTSTWRLSGRALNHDGGPQVTVLCAGSPDGGSSLHQGESRARPSPARLMASPPARCSPPRLQAMAQVARQPLRCSQRAPPPPGASFLPSSAQIFTTFHPRIQCAGEWAGSLKHGIDLLFCEHRLFAAVTAKVAAGTGDTALAAAKS